MEYPLTDKYIQEEAKTLQDAKRMLVLANRIIANQKVVDAYGHISVRNPENPNSFLISHAISPELVTMDDIMTFDLDGKVMGGDKRQAFSERYIHAAVYKRRPEMNSVVHPHPPEILPFASTNVPLRSVYHQNVCFFDGIPTFGDIPPECGMLISKMEVAEKLAEALDGKRGVLVRNHGVVVIGESIPRTVYSIVYLCENAKILLNTLALSKEPSYIDRESLEYGTHLQFCGLGLPRTWNYWCIMAKRAFPDIADLPH